MVMEFQDIFGGVGRYKGPEIKIQIRENIQPVIQPHRRIPLHYVKPLEDHLAESLLWRGHWWRKKRGLGYPTW